MFSPLEQFNVLNIDPCFLFDIDVSYTNILVPLTIAIILSLFFINFFLELNYLIPNNLNMIFEILFNFILNILKQQSGKKALIYFPFFFFVFFSILICNLLSLLPFGIALTSHIILILYMSVTFFSFIILIGVLKHQLNFFFLFIPKCPFILMFILIPIEIFSYIIRIFSLSIRLTANILAGHTLVYIISSFIFKMTLLNIIFYFIFLIPLILILLLELGVAFLQAFVFTILLSIYLSESLKHDLKH